MEQQELLERFNGLLADYRKHRQYIRRVQEQSEKFSPAVIERVKLDHEVKSAAVAEEILPLVGDMNGHVEAIQNELQSITDGKGDSDVEMEELNLRLAIGEIDEDEFASLSEGVRSILDDAEGRLSSLRTQLESLQSVLGEWEELAVSAGQETGLAAAIEDSVQEESAEPAAQVEAELEEDEPAEEAPVEEEVEAPEAEASDDLSPAEQDIFGDADDEVSFDAGESEGDIALDLVGGGNAGEASGDEIAIDLDGAGSGETEEESKEEGGDETRRALLLYQEGTPEEQIYPFTNDVLTVGRGRDNDIQIKNDSKVSRFHCKLYRRNGNYYIEDNKSSNGTLVNSELITERRLFGGEEVIIGETFFRFRLM